MRSEELFIEWDNVGFTIKINDKVFETDQCGFFNENMGMTLVDVLKHLGHVVEHTNHCNEDDIECAGWNG